MKLLIFFNNKKQTKMAQEIQPGQKITGQLIVWDDVTNAQVGAWFTNVVITSSNDTIATGSQNHSSTDNRFIDFTGVAVGSATIHISATANYTNSSNILVAQTKTVDVDVLVANPANPTSLRLQF
jgi:hypothetical protein